LTFWLVRKYLIVPVGKALDERRQRIETAEASWNSKHEEYLSQTSRLEGEMEEAMREAAQVRAEHRQRALEAREERLREARETAGGRLEQALAQLDQDAAAARSDLETKAAVLAREFASRLLGRKVAS
jgi:F0F1-type ATP synthase membrane subunit b/b'